MPRNLCWVLLALALILAACAPPPPPPQATPSTPPAALPVSVTQAQPTALPTALPDAIIDAADAEYLVLTNLYERTSPSVVNISATTNTQSGGQFTLEVSGGSGFVYDREGHIVTNAHVVRGARDIRVTFNDGYVADARVIGTDSYSDLAVIQVTMDGARLNPLTMGDSQRVRVGERVVAIGNPFGLASSMTSGIVSALGRQLSSAEIIGDEEAAPGFQNPSIIQFDANINPGNSGGPLMNSRGEVIGVNTAIRTSSGTFEGVGFAVPAATVRRVVPELIAKGQVDYPWLGISARGNEDGFGVAGLAELLNLPVRAGVLISSVSPQSPAAKAGLLGGSRWQTIRGQQVCVGGDIIVAIDGLYVNSLDDLMAQLIAGYAPQDTVTLRVVRGAETFDIPVLLESRPGDSTMPNCGN